MAGGSKNHRRILGREPWSAAQKRSWGRKTRRALQLAPLFVSLDRADAIIEGARHAVPACPALGGERAIGAFDFYVAHPAVTGVRIFVRTAPSPISTTHF